MSKALALHASPEHLRLRDDLTAARALLAERELQLAALRTELKSFEGRYLRQVGVLYAELDEIEARIAEHEVRLYDSPEARDRANAARRRAYETHEAAFGVEEPETLEPSSDIKKLFREVARRVHPDRARDAAELAHCNRLMALANRAYAHADADALQRLLDDAIEESASDNEDLATEILRLTRQLAHAHRDIAAIDTELSTLPTNEIAQLKIEADAVDLEGRDLLAELAAILRDRITDANYRLTFLERQLFAHGK